MLKLKHYLCDRFIHSKLNFQPYLKLHCCLYNISLCGLYDIAMRSVITAVVIILLV